MNNAVLVSEVKCVEDLDYDLEFLDDRQVAALSNDFVERRTIQVLHHQVRAAVFFTQFVNNDNIGMLEVAYGPRFYVETSEKFGVLGEIALDDLNGDGTTDTRVGGLIDGAHAAFAEHFHHFVLADF